MPEKSFGSLDCLTCKKSARLTPSNTTAFIYEDERFNHLRIRCDCGAPTILYCDQSTIKEALDNDCGAIHDKHVPERIVELYCQVNELPFAGEIHELTPRLESEIERFGEVLATCPDELLFDAITAPHKPDRPERWI